MDRPSSRNNDKCPLSPYPPYGNPEFKDNIVPDSAKLLLPHRGLVVWHEEEDREVSAIDSIFE
jgi:hypothetical protein